MEFILLLLIIFVVVPIVRAAVAMYRVRRKVRDLFGQFGQRPGDRAAGQPQPQPRKKRKKINPDDGEFVQYEDLPPSTGDSPAASVKVEIEQQIVDVEWEDIKQP